MDATSPDATSPDQPVDPSASEQSAAGPGPVRSDPTALSQDELRERYREALGRKHGHGAGTDGTAGSAGKGGRPGGSGPAKSQRTFRRKSGG